MANLSKEKREKIFEYLKNLKKEESNSESLILISEIEKILSNKKYGLIWEEHSEKVDEKLKKNIPIFEEKEELKIKTLDTNDYNFLIEGDNLHSLKLLNKTHREKIDLIYVDFPYNTESKDFKYNDTFVDKTDGFRHSKWLSFVNRRLKLAYNLLKNDGCILMSINENELFVLKSLCDEIFGENNYLTMITIKVRHEDRILKGDKDFHEVTEFLLFYRKTSNFEVKKREKDNTDISEYIYSVVEKTKNPEKIIFDDKVVEIFKPDEYELKTNLPSEKFLKKINIRGSIKEGNSSGRFYVKHLEKLMEEKEGNLFKVYDMGADGIGYRYFRIPLLKEKRVNGDYFQGVPLEKKDIKLIPFPNFIEFDDEFNNVSYEGGVNFKSKKPCEFLKYCFKIANLESKPNAIVLDFFAGSGSTGEALLKFNKDFGGNRKFVLCTNNEISFALEQEYIKSKKLTKNEFKNLMEEKNEELEKYIEKNGICTSITYPRLKNVAFGYTRKIGKKEIPIQANKFNLKYLKTNFIPKFKEDISIREMILLHVKELIELEYMCEIDEINNLLIFEEEELDNINIIDLKDNIKIFLSSNILLSSSQKYLINKKNIKIIYIPEYYFSEELLEVGEI